ncbi:MAG: YHS domain-containing protein [candidate division Zixibacteria bacterium]|nr:YHS domain-containing protein [candidate division Zixibacteria bacterium]
MKKIWLTIAGVLIILVLFLGFSTGFFGSKSEKAPKMAVCPVCKMKVLVTEETPSYVYEGKTYYFMNEEHKNIFVEDPERFLK